MSSWIRLRAWAQATAKHSRQGVEDPGSGLATRSYQPRCVFASHAALYAQAATYRNLREHRPRPFRRTAQRCGEDLRKKMIVAKDNQPRQLLAQNRTVKRRTLNRTTHPTCARTIVAGVRNASSRVASLHFCTHLDFVESLLGCSVSSILQAYSDKATTSSRSFDSASTGNRAIPCSTARFAKVAAGRTTELQPCLPRGQS